MRLSARVTIREPDQKVRVEIPSTGEVLEGPWRSILQSSGVMNALLSFSEFKVTAIR